MVGFGYVAHATGPTCRKIISFATSARYLTRRYNQSAELARRLAASDDFAPGILLRRHHSKSQAGLSRTQNQKNVASIFSMPPKSRAIFLADQRC